MNRRYFLGASLAALAAAVAPLPVRKIAFIGKRWKPRQTPKSVKFVTMRFGTVTKQGSALTILAQDVNIGVAQVPVPRHLLLADFS